MHLCIDMGSTQIKCGLFDGEHSRKIFRIENLEDLKKNISGLSLTQGLLVCSDSMKAREWTQQISAWGISMKSIQCDDFLSHASPETKELLFPDTIAKIYGALTLCPLNDCLVVDFGTTVRYELISKEGKLLGRATFPFFELLYRSLSVSPQYLDEHVPPPLGQNPIASINSGCYYGLLGSVERIISEIRLQSPNPSEIMTIATGALTEKESWKNPLSELVDQIYPSLVLEGLHQMIKEGAQS